MLYRYLYLLLQLHVLGALVAAHLEEVRGRAHPVLPHGVEVVVGDALLLAELPAKRPSMYIYCSKLNIQLTSKPFVILTLQLVQWWGSGSGSPWGRGGALFGS